MAVISDGLWEREFGRSASALGETIKLNDVPVTIVGVNPRVFTGVDSVQQSPDAFVPMAMQPLVSPPRRRPFAAVVTYEHAEWWVSVMGRTRTGVSDTHAQTALDTQLVSTVRATMPVRPGEGVSTHESARWQPRVV